MNIRYKLERAEVFLNENALDKAEELIFYVEDHLKAGDPNGVSGFFIFCCFHKEGNIIHCGKTPDEPFLPGTLEERYELCRKCRAWCRAKVEELRKKINEKKEMEKFKEEFFSKKTPLGGMYLPPWVRK